MPWKAQRTRRTPAGSRRRCRLVRRHLACTRYIRPIVRKDSVSAPGWTGPACPGRVPARAAAAAAAGDGGWFPGGPRAAAAATISSSRAATAAVSRSSWSSVPCSTWTAGRSVSPGAKSRWDPDRVRGGAAPPLSLAMILAALVWGPPGPQARQPHRQQPGVGETTGRLGLTRVPLQFQDALVRIGAVAQGRNHLAGEAWPRRFAPGAHTG